MERVKVVGGVARAQQELWAEHTETPSIGIAIPERSAGRLPLTNPAAAFRAVGVATLSEAARSVPAPGRHSSFIVLCESNALMVGAWERIWVHVSTATEDSFSVAVTRRTDSY